MRIITNSRKFLAMATRLGYRVHLVPTRSLRQLLSAGDYDAVYYARFVPPLVDLPGEKPPGQVVVGSHVPLRVDHPVRPHHLIHGFVYPPQIYLYWRWGH